MDGVTHARASAALAATGGIVVTAITGDLKAGASFACGCALGVMMTPDLDQEGIGKGEWKLIQASLGVGFLWVWLWYPYARAIKHRSFLSHAPLVGTAGRLIYLLCLPTALWLAGKISLEWIPIWICLWAIAGLVVSDIGHWVLDFCVHRKSNKY